MRGGKRKGAGRKTEDDPRIPLPFRLKTSAVKKAKRLGRDRIEAMIKRAKEPKDMASCEWCDKEYADGAGIYGHGFGFCSIDCEQSHRNEFS